MKQIFLLLAILCTYNYTTAQSCNTQITSNSNLICAGSTATLIAVSNVGGGSLGSFPTGYCSASANSVFDGDIFEVIYQGINRTSDCTTVGPGASNGLPASIINRYTNYTNDSIAYVIKGTTNNITVKLSCCTSTAFNYCIAVFIDLNADGILDTTERVCFSTPTTVPVSPALTTITKSITIPNTAISGYTLMRIIATETTNGANITPCSNITWGEIEDYKILISDSVNEMLYNWQPSNAILSNSGNTIVANPTVTTTYTCYTTALNCTDTSLYTLNVLPNTLVTNMSFSPVTTNNPLNGLAAVATTGNNGYLNFSWAPGDSTRSIITKRNIGWQTVTVTDSLGCYKTDSIYIGYATSVEHNTKNNLLIVAPNPAPNYLEYTLPSNNIPTLYITDASGKIITTINTLNKISGNLDCSALPNGVYFLSDGKKLSTKFVKL